MWNGGTGQKKEILLAGFAHVPAVLRAGNIQTQRSSFFFALGSINSITMIHSNRHVQMITAGQTTCSIGLANITNIQLRMKYNTVREHNNMEFNLLKDLHCVTAHLND